MVLKKKLFIQDKNITSGTVQAIKVNQKNKRMGLKVV